MSHEKIAIKAHAKINIGLHITNRLPNGYHELESIFQEIDLHDKIYLERLKTDEIVIETEHADLPIDKKNICYQAVERMREAANKEIGVKIFIEKNIPIGAGLGGGSSDAAAVIQAVNKFYQLRLEEEQIYEIARSLGADVAFFLKGGTALVTGIGDVVQPISLPFDFKGVLIYPNLQISTEWVYKNFKFNLTKTKKIIKLAHFKGFEGSLKQFFQNDLERVVFEKYPYLAEIKDLFYKQGAFFASMSGSGSAIYGLFEDESLAKQAKQQFGAKYKTFLIQPLKRNIYNERGA